MEQKYENGERLLAIPNSKGFLCIPEEKIVCCRADGNYSIVVLSNGERHTITRTIGKIEKVLSRDIFCRIHQSSIINVREVYQFHKGPPVTVEMKNGMQFTIARKRKSDFLDHFTQI